MTFGDHAPIMQQATNTIPIVAISDDILGAGLITSLSHPDRNTTGLTIMSPELSAKRLEVLQEIIPGLARVACLWDPTTGASQVAQTKAAARSLNLNLQIIEVRRRNDVTDAFRSSLRRPGRGNECLLISVSLCALPGDYLSFSGIPATGDLSMEGARRSWRFNLFWAEPRGDVSTGRNDRGQNS